MLQELGTSEKDLHASLVITVLVKFLYLFVASMFMGLVFGLGTSFLMKRFKSNSVPQVRPLFYCSSSFDVPLLCIIHGCFQHEVSAFILPRPPVQKCRLAAGVMLCLR